jgi:hypothetical protein
VEGENKFRKDKVCGVTLDFVAQNFRKLGVPCTFVSFFQKNEVFQKSGPHFWRSATSLAGPNDGVCGGRKSQKINKNAFFTHPFNEYIV